MSNYKIRVNSKAKSKEAQQLFFELGYEKGACSTGGYPALIIATPESRFQKTPYSSRATSLNHESHSQYKEITLPELRDMVVLKRNDVGDATHEDYTGLKYLLLTHTRHAWGGDKWLISSADFSKLKPIEKPMKEYLRKNSNGTYSYIGTVRPEHVSDFMIEIPEWAVAYADHKNGYGFFYDSFCKIASFYNIVWSRPTHPEELPFIDDEPLLQTEIESELDQAENLRELLTPYTQPLNDQYAEIEKVRQSAWQKQEGGSHYKNLKIQPMQYALENKLDYAQANVVKYVTRHKEKNGKEDLLKAIHNIELMIEFYYGDEK